MREYMMRVRHAVNRQRYPTRIIKCVTLTTHCKHIMIKHGNQMVGIFQQFNLLCISFGGKSFMKAPTGFNTAPKCLSLHIEVYMTRIRFATQWCERHKPICTYMQFCILYTKYCGRIYVLVCIHICVGKCIQRRQQCFIIEIECR